MAPTAARAKTPALATMGAAPLLEVLLLPLGVLALPVEVPVLPVEVPVLPVEVPVLPIEVPELPLDVLLPPEEEPVIVPAVTGYPRVLQPSANSITRESL
jgi:hypothetical protein